MIGTLFEGSVTQMDMLLEHLRSGRSITSLEALEQYGIGRLSPRILELKRKGHRIESKPRTVFKANGKKATVSEYYL